MRKLLPPFAVALLLCFVAFAQNAAPKAPITPSQAVLTAWNDIGRKLIAMAEDFPEDKYDFKPVPAQRSFAEQLLHVAGSNEMFTSATRGKKPVDDESRAHYPTKAAVIAYLKQTITDGASILQTRGDRGMTDKVMDPESGETMQLVDLAYEDIEHSGEHYGQLVVYYRVAGMVPPESRPKK